MAHYAVINPSTNLVIDIFVGRDEHDHPQDIDDWEIYYAPAGMICRRTSYNTQGGVHYTDGQPSEDQSKAFRKNYAGIGYIYDAALDAFIPPKPAEGDWVLDEDTCLWVKVEP
jgi:hypothetical protein